MLERFGQIGENAVGVAPLPDSPVVRRDVFSDGGQQDLTWYAVGVAELQSRPISERTSWRFFAAIHGFDQDFWTRAGAWEAGDPLPGDADPDQFWLQCQHASWYFLPWHRGYLMAFEALMRDAIVAKNGPATWALPYWNYFNPGQNKLPSAFADPGTAAHPNRLFVVRRYGPSGDGQNVRVPTNKINQAAFEGAGIRRRGRRRQRRLRRADHDVPTFVPNGAGRSPRAEPAQQRSRPGRRHAAQRPDHPRSHGRSRHRGARPDLLAPPCQHRPDVGAMAAHAPGGSTPTRRRRTGSTDRATARS